MSAQTTHRTIQGRGGFDEVHIGCPYGKVVVSTLGATVLSYVPTKLDRDIFWLSTASEFRQGKGIRGGVPICWPWFGPKEGQLSHGVARTTPWTIAQLGSRGADAMAVFELGHSPSTLDAWPHPFRMTFTVLLGRSLRLELGYHNLDAQPVRCSGALHSYLRVDDVHRIQVNGLNGAKVTDQVTGDTSVHEGPLTLDGRVDRIYHDVKGPVSVVDGRKRVTISGSSNTVVAWNPGKAIASKMADVRRYKQFVCVESAHIAPDDVVVAPGEVATLQATFRA